MSRGKDHGIINKAIKSRIEEQYRKMLRFKNEYGLKTNPLKSLREWAEHIIIDRGGYCPCNNTRPQCPCKEALSEIKENGKCLCGKFFSPEKFEEIWGEYLTLMEKKKYR